jgi:hypothetical protein
VQTKGIRNICSKRVTENFPNLEKATPTGHQTDLTKIELPHDIFSLKQQAHRIEKEY